MSNQLILDSAPVSVIIPCYKCAGTIYRAVLSVWNQTLKPRELILVDDASGDGTLSELLSIEKQYSGWIKVIALNSNKGAASARNVGWSAATQPYIALLDADDAWHPKKIEIQYQFMQKNPQVVLCGHFAKIIADDSQLDWLLSKTDFKYISKARLLISNQFVTPSVMVRRDVTHRFDSTKRYMEDHLLWLQIVFDNQQVAKLNLALVAMYKQAYGVSGLSSHMWAMEKSELANYWQLYKSKNIGFVYVVMLHVYSLAKFLRRLILVSFRRITFVKI